MSQTQFLAPKVGDTVNYVTHNWKSVIPAKITAIPEKHAGRLVTLEIPDKSKNGDGDEVVTVKQIPATFRPKDDRIGNTWHFALLLALLTFAFGLQRSALANIPTYRTLSAYGNNTLPATAIFPADPNSQIRIVSVNYSSDIASGLMNFSSGTTAFSLIWTNPTTSWTTNVITSTNGLAAGAGLFLQHGGLVFTNTASSWANTGTNSLTIAGVTITNTTTTFGTYGTGPVGFAATNLNYVITGFGWGVLLSAGDEIYLQGPITSVQIGAGTNWLNGDDIFSGNYGRPVEVQIPTATATNRLASVSSHYDSASQP
jgi:hypothetical protein